MAESNNNGSPVLYWLFIIAIMITLCYMAYVASKPPEGSIDPDTCENGCVVMGRCGTKAECDDTEKLKVFLWLTVGVCLFCSLLGCCGWIMRKRAERRRLAEEDELNK